mmetsp:Transcript_20259/g.67597  ORF Transcript_20259/g.67597 Transcript_20259/m.67597 type:complete len:307 (+) Transcript_20259:1524-2444(+)
MWAVAGLAEARKVVLLVVVVSRWSLPALRRSDLRRRLRVSDAPELIEPDVSLVHPQLELEQGEAVHRLGGDVHDDSHHVGCQLGDGSELGEKPEGRVAAPDAEVEGEGELERRSNLLRVLVEKLLEPRVDEADDADPREGKDEAAEHEPEVPRRRLERVAEDSACDGQPDEERVGDLVGEVERPQQIQRQDRTGEDVVQVLEVVDRQRKAHVIVEVSADTAPVGDGSDEVDVDGEALLFPVADEELLVAIGALERHELVHEGERSTKKTKKSQPINSDHGRVVKIEVWKARIVPSSHAILPIGIGE